MDLNKVVKSLHEVDKLIEEKKQSEYMFQLKLDYLRHSYGLDFDVNGTPYVIIIFNWRLENDNKDCGSFSFRLWDKDTQSEEFVADSLKTFIENKFIDTLKESISHVLEKYKQTMYRTPEEILEKIKKDFTVKSIEDNFRKKELYNYFKEKYGSILPDSYIRELDENFNIQTYSELLKNPKDVKDGR